MQRSVMWLDRIASFDQGTKSLMFQMLVNRRSTSKLAIEAK